MEFQIKLNYDVTVVISIGSDSTMVTAHPASTVVLLKGISSGFELLLLKRNETLDFCGGDWVFPGGRIDPEDYPPGDNDIMAAAKQAGVREVFEETGITIRVNTLIFMSHWTTPAFSFKRFSTYFFVAAVNETPVAVDGEEIMDFRWRQPEAAIAEHHSGEIYLPYPTLKTVESLSRYSDVETVLEAVKHSSPKSY